MCRAHHHQLKRGAPLKPIKEPRPRGARLERDDQGRKHCARCKLWYAPEGFALDRKSGDGLSSWCRRCAHLSQFHILPQDYDAMLAAQGGVCKGCGRLPDGRALQVDHDHACCPEAGRSCGQCIRGLMCFSCNTVLGHVADNPALLRRLASYLEGQL